MTNGDIVRKYLEHSGRYLKQGEEECFAPMLPYLILDAMFQLYDKNIKPIPCQRDLKKYKRDWIKAYSEYNKDFFSAFDPDEVCYITDKMDEFEAFIAHDLFIVQMSIHKECMHLDAEQRNIVSAIILCGVLAQAAECVYEDTYTNGSVPAVNPRIKNIVRNISLFRETYHIGNKDIDVNISDEVCKAVNILCRKMVDWLYDGDKDYQLT